MVLSRARAVVLYPFTCITVSASGFGWYCVVLLLFITGCMYIFVILCCVFSGRFSCFVHTAIKKVNNNKFWFSCH